MTLEIRGISYVITEQAQEWKIERSLGVVSAVYRIKKADAPTFEDVREIIESRTDIFGG